MNDEGHVTIVFTYLTHVQGRAAIGVVARQPRGHRVNATIRGRTRVIGARITIVAIETRVRNGHAIAIHVALIRGAIANVIVRAHLADTDHETATAIDMAHGIQTRIRRRGARHIRALTCRISET